MKTWSGIVGVVIAVSLGALGGESAPAQEKPPSAHHPDYRKCKKCAPALAKAMAYLKANLDSTKVKRPIGCPAGGYMMAGFAFMMDQNGEAWTKELERCVEDATKQVHDDYFNRNWYLAMGLFFLSEYSMKYGMTPKIEKALKDGLKNAREQQEETGGWCHNLGMWKGGYNKNGGGKDLGMATAMIYGALLEMKALGLGTGDVAARAQKNLEDISDGVGIRYGTDNGVGDAGMARASYVLLALQATGNVGHPFYAKYLKGLDQRYKHIDEEIHGYSPLHYFSVAAAMHRAGPEEYRKYVEEYLDKMIASQTPEGVITLRADDDIANTAVFAAIVMMQKDRAFFPRASRLDRPSPRSNKEEYRLGTEALAREEYGRAYQHFENVIPDRDSEDLVPRAREKMQRISEQSFTRLKEAETFVSVGDPAEAIKAFQAIERDFQGLPASTEAKSRVQDLRTAGSPKKS
ncbi:MAG TPA: hypothetical protein VEN81_15250 [Planctomycetota bacterium]|nr:hypothetical protein [Planctomycetota bacterium]